MRGGVGLVQKPSDDDAAGDASSGPHIEKGRACREARALEQREQDEALPDSAQAAAGEYAGDGRMRESSASWAAEPPGVGGDCFDAISSTVRASPSRLPTSSAKGSPAALLMSETCRRPSARSPRRQPAPAGHLSEREPDSERQYRAGTSAIGFFCCTRGYRSGRVSFSSAGHHPPILGSRATGPVELATAEGGPCCASSFPGRLSRTARSDSAAVTADPLHGRDHRRLPAAEENGDQTRP